MQKRKIDDNPINSRNKQKSGKRANQKQRPKSAKKLHLTKKTVIETSSKEDAQMELIYANNGYWDLGENERIILFGPSVHLESYF